MVHAGKLLAVMAVIVVYTMVSGRNRGSLGRIWGGYGTITQVGDKGTDTVHTY